jgi:hypothetical protein
VDRNGNGSWVKWAFLYSNLVFYFAHIRIQCTCLEAAVEFVVVPSRSSGAFYSASERHIMTISRESPLFHIINRHSSSTSSSPSPAMEEPPLNAVNPLPSYHPSHPCQH